MQDDVAQFPSECKRGSSSRFKILCDDDDFGVVCI